MSRSLRPALLPPPGHSQPPRPWAPMKHQQLRRVSGAPFPVTPGSAASPWRTSLQPARQHLELDQGSLPALWRGRSINSSNRSRCHSAPIAETLSDCLSGFHPAIFLDRPTALLAQFVRELVRMHHPPCDDDCTGRAYLVLRDRMASVPPRCALEADFPAHGVHQPRPPCGLRIDALVSCGIDIPPRFHGALAAQSHLFRPVEPPTRKHAASTSHALPTVTRSPPTHPSHRSAVPAITSPSALRASAISGARYQDRRPQAPCATRFRRVVPRTVRARDRRGESSRHPLAESSPAKLGLPQC